MRTSASPGGKFKLWHRPFHASKVISRNMRGKSCICMNSLRKVCSLSLGIMYKKNSFPILKQDISSVKFSSSEQCTFCENTSESLLHLFWECPKTKLFWNKVIKWLGNFSCLLTKSFSPQLCLGFVDDTTALLLHHALLIARYHITFFGLNQCTTSSLQNFSFGIF